LEEVRKVLEGFDKDKGLRPDNWTIEVFLEFFDIVGLDILEVVEEPRPTSFVSRAMNPTFIALIPKGEKLDTFLYYRSIALCNLLYKVISKIISNRIKPGLSRCMSREQFAFLENRKMVDTIGVAQESIHSIKNKN